MRQLVKKLNMQVTTTNASPSAVGDSRIEASPLGLRIFSVLDLTEDVLRRAGIERGMRVLDLECEVDWSFWPGCRGRSITGSHQCSRKAGNSSRLLLLDAVCRRGSQHLRSP